MVYGATVNFVAQTKPYITLSNGLMVARNDADAGGGASWYDAITLCNNSTLAGFTDWRLPTKYELVGMYKNKDLIGNFESGYYWSSSTGSANNYAYFVNFSSGKVSETYWYVSNYVRCVRTAD